MPISTVIAKKVYTGNDVTTEFPFAYRFFATSDLVVEKYTIADGTLETLTEGEGEDYTVVGGDDGDGGTTDYTSGGTVVLASALEDEYKLIITRVLPLTQTFDFAPNSPFSEDSFEEVLDRMIAIVQQQQAELDRCIKMDKSYSSVSGVFDVDDLEVTVDDFIIDELTAKTTIGSSDYVAIADGDASNVNKKILASSIISINGLTEDTSLHANDVFLFEDSQASYVKKKVTRNNLVNINSLTEKTSVHANDLFIIEDSESSNAKKKVKHSNIADTKISKTTAGEIAAMTEKTTLVDADLFIIEDSEQSNAKKKVQRSNVVPDIIKLKSVTSVTGATNSGNVTIEVNKQYLAVITVRADSGDGTNCVPTIYFNDDTDSNYAFARSDLTFASPPVESFEGEALSGATGILLPSMGGETEGGVLYLNLHIDTHSLNRSVNTVSACVNGTGTISTGTGAFTGFRINGIYDVDSNPVSFEIATAQSCDIVIRLYEFEQS